MKLLLALTMLAGVCVGQQKSEASLSDQKLCYEQGRESAGKHTMVMQHYSKRLGVCFVRLYQTLYDDSGKFQGTAVSLEDGFEGVSYGACFINAEGKMMSGPVDCFVSDPAGGKDKTFEGVKPWLNFVMSTYFSKDF